MVNVPLSEVVVVFSTLVSLFFRTIMAPATTAPVGSVTDPEIDPAFVTCAFDDAQNSAMTSRLNIGARLLFMFSSQRLWTLLRLGVICETMVWDCGYSFEKSNKGNLQASLKESKGLGFHHDSLQIHG
jgi:hypothetical protein